jgi:proline racemase
MRISTVDGHVAGAPVRLVTGGLPPVTGDTLAARAAARADVSGAALQSLCREPRGHDGVIVALLAEPDAPDSDAALLLFDADDPVAFSGHGVIGGIAMALSDRLIQPRHPDRVSVETLAGTVGLRVTPGAGPLPRLALTSGPVVVLRGNQPVTVSRRALRADLVWTQGGAVAIVDAEAAGAPLVASRALELGRVGREVLSHLAEAVRVTDPVTGARVPIEAAVFIGAPPEGGADVRSATVTATGRVLRSPGTTATAAIATVLSAMGMLASGGRLAHQGLLGPSLDATVLSLRDVEGRAVAEVEVAGDVWPLGRSEFRIDPGDPLREGVTWI